ncbi:unnamed protein product [Ilex paraguariensis]|uniref:RNA-dependent RNA polymerase n=1 Tax=Ilex paraguariensis TaxID=185542 RepID=A0ABC8R8W7_9AQUA
MADPSELTLPQSVEQLLQKICVEQSLPPPDTHARRVLARLGEETSLDILTKISISEVRTLNGFIVHMAKKYYRPVGSPGSAQISPQKRSSPCSPSAYAHNDSGYNSPIPKHLVLSPPCSPQITGTQSISHQLLVLSQLEFRKAFLVLSYIGRCRLEEVMTAGDADDILKHKNQPMRIFESQIWSTYGQHYCDESDCRKSFDWDSGKTRLYYCHVYPDGSYNFKGPYLDTTRTHLQRELGDDNVLIVKFAEKSVDCTDLPNGSSNCHSVYNKIAKEGILVGLRRYHFFVFKDGGKEEKKKSPTSSAIKCYFVRMESVAPSDERESYILSRKMVYQARSLFMHVHMVSSMAKYMARFSLILSKTIKLPVDLTSVHIEKIEDILCQDENGSVVYDDGERLIHTDGTGYISEDLAMRCPEDFYNAKYIKDDNFQKVLELRGTETRSREPPLLMQCRLFYNGCAVKGTLLVNRKLPPRTIQIRPSMVKVEADPRLLNAESLNSLEIVAISHKPRRTFLSKNLIALLHYNGVPKEIFLELLTNALEDSQKIYSNKRAALRVALNHGENDDNFLAASMILSGVPLNEPCLQHRLSHLRNEERKGLKGGKLPISECFYLMGTVDPTGELNNDEVCVIVHNGQLSGDVLVYRNPGLHFGDIHVLRATYVKALEDIVGNAKHAIFFSTKGPRSVANEIANGDFDGDMYWVSKNSQLFKYFEANKPWKRCYSTPKALNRKPSEFSPEELEHELFQLFLKSREPRLMFQVN